MAKVNAFDFVITVALGSTLATIVLSSYVSLVERGAAARAMERQRVAETDGTRSVIPTTEIVSAWALRDVTETDRG